MPGSRLVKRPARSKPDCGHCPKELAWTPENRVRAQRWLAWRDGLLGGPADDAERWDFFRLSEADRELDGEVFKNNLAEVIGGLFGGD